MSKIARDNPAKAVTSLTLGTVQLGQAYGIANRAGMPGLDEAMAVLDAAWDGGVRSLDTARAYGEAEGRVGAWIAARGHRPFLVTKVAPLPGDGCCGDAIADSVDRSFSALGVDFVDGLMMHRASDLHRPGVVRALGRMVAAGRVGSFGVSAYRPEDVAAALAVPGLGMVQVPFNLFDRRMEASGLLERCAGAGVLVFARSLFLQGLFFLDPDRLPVHLAPAAGPLRRLGAFAGELGRGIAELAVAAVRDTPGVTSMVVGAEQAAQVSEIVAMAAAPPLTADERAEAFRIGADLPEPIYNPALWSR